MTELLRQATASQNQASHPGSSVWVSASAGTGKTKVLTDRLLRLLLEGNEPHRILCLTFTKAAAAEMANRLYEHLSRWAVLSDGDLLSKIGKLDVKGDSQDLLSRARRLFTYVLDTPGGLKIQTIHGFCQSLLKRFPLEVGISPHFEVLEEQSAKHLMQQAQMMFLESRSKSVLQEEALGIVARQYDNTTLSSLLDEILKVNGFASPTSLDFGTINYEKGLNGATLRWAAEILQQGKATDQERGHILFQAVQKGIKNEADFLTYKSVYLTQGNEIRKKLCPIDLARTYPDLQGILTVEAERVQSILEEGNTQKVSQFTAGLKIIAKEIIDIYQELKHQNSYLDYDDLISKTERLLSQPDLAPWVLYKLDGGLDHILVDEAQDTSPQQWSIITALAEEFFHNTNDQFERTLFVVGDTKQSIYSFQQADPESFSVVRNKFSKFSKDLRRPWTVVDLNTSFRTSEAVLKVVDNVFAKEEQKNSLLLGAQELKHHAYRKGNQGKVELWPIIAPEQKQDSEIWEVPVQDYEFQKDPEQQLAEKISNRISQMLERKEVLEPKGRPIRPSDILILVQRRGSFVSKLIRALKQKNIPVAGSDRMKLMEQLVIKDLIALGEFLLLTADDLSLATVLKSPLFNLGDDDLIRLCPERRGSLWQALLASSDYPQTVEKLKGLLNLRGFVRPYELYSYILSSLNGRQDFVKRLGQECLDPLDEFMNQVLKFEQSNTPTLQGFIQYMLSSEIEIKRDFDQGTRDELRVMTVHGAKGLQAPIVILPDTVRTPSQSQGILPTEEDFLWSPPQSFDTLKTKSHKAQVQKDALREYWRLLYVAMTRAEDQLYICGWQTSRSPSETNWYSVIKSSLEEIGILDDRGETWVYETDQLVPVDLIPGERPKVENQQVATWVHQKAALERETSQWVNPSEMDSEDETDETKYAHTRDYAAQRGTLIHKLLEINPDVSELEERIEGLGSFLDSQQKSEIRGHVQKVLESSNFKEISGPNSWVEIPIVGELDGIYYSGQIDRLVIEQDCILIVDYKTNQFPAQSVSEIPMGYVQQLEVYRRLLKPLYPSKDIAVAIFWTESCRLMKVDDHQDLAA